MNRWGLFCSRRLALLALAVGCAGSFAAAPVARGDDALESARRNLDETFRQQLAALAAKCDELGLPEQARLTRAWQLVRDPRLTYLFDPFPVDPTRPATSAKPPIPFWHAKLMTHRQQQADGLFALARKAVEQGQTILAYQLLHEALRENPDHADTRRVLRHVRVGGQWRAAGDVETARLSTVAHPKLPWPARKYWRVETTHFEIATNAGIDAGKELGQKLEDLHSAWQQLFVPYWLTRDELVALFAGRAGPSRLAAKHRVVLFSGREEYVRVLSEAEPQIGITLGIYLDREKTAFFYHDNERIVSTWYHEATHQLFHEAPGVADQVGRQANFWMIEGIAMYLESLFRHEGYFTVGGATADRLQFARYRALNEQNSTPLAQLVRMGRDQLQGNSRIRQLYSQSAGMAQFLMEYDGGRYREAALAYLRTIYQQQDSPDTLAQLTQTILEELDAQYRTFLDVGDADLASLEQLPRVQRLSLGHTRVTDAGLAHAAGLKDLVWLDLAYTQTTDAGLAVLAGMSRLNQLNLERTQATDAVLPILGRLTQLEELDLSGTKVTDQGIAALENLKNLKVLWLTDTAVTDASIPVLKKFRQLETLDLSGTRMTPAGQQQLQQALPNLKPVGQ